MKDFVSKLLSNHILEARNTLENRLEELIELKLEEAKLNLVEKIYGNVEHELFVESTIGQSNVIKTGRTRIVKVRVRKGKIQRRKKFSTVKGYTIRGGQMVRMMPSERRHRKIAALRSRFKRKAKSKIAQRRRIISLTKRGSMGL
jgi:hypothetical protein